MSFHRASPIDCRLEGALSSLLCQFEHFLARFGLVKMKLVAQTQQGAHSQRCAAKISVDWDGILPTEVEREGDFLITYIRIAADDSGQGVWHSIQAFMTGLLLLRKQYPFLHEGFLSSDGATNFKSLLFLLMLPHVSVRTGMKLLGHMLPEAGGGKDKCDRDFAGVNHLFNSWISQPGSSLSLSHQ